MAKKNDLVKAEAATIQSVEQIENLILTIRGKQVILDRDLARLYGVETRVLNTGSPQSFARKGCLKQFSVTSNVFLRTLCFGSQKKRLSS